jgi:hypothetical protein
MLNTALFFLRMTQYDRAFRILGQAEALATQTREPGNAWLVMYQQAMLVREAGAQLGPDQLVAGYFEKAQMLLEEAPLLHAARYGRVRAFYEDYAVYLSAKGQHRNAVLVLEKGNRQLRRSVSCVMPRWYRMPPTVPRYLNSPSAA